MQFFCYHNGLFLPQIEAVISVKNLGFTRGYAAFELFRTYGKEPFYLKEHLERLKKNAALLKLNYPNNTFEIIAELLEKNPFDDIVIRIYLSEDESGKPDFLALADPIQLPPIAHYETGIKIITTSLTRHLYPIKSTSYTAALIALKEAAEVNADDAIFLSKDHHLLELTKSNFFAVINGTLYTPKDEMLLGITRAIVINLAKENGIPLKEGPIPLSSLPLITEAFSTSTIREILPITQINKQEIPLGPFTKALQEAFALEPARHYRVSAGENATLN